MKAHKKRSIVLTGVLLEAYQTAAMSNAGDLLAEARALLAAGHCARAYFLSVAGIEEIGKAVQAFAGRGRKLSNPAICTKLQTDFESHSAKITSAFTPWLLDNPNLRSEIMNYISLMVDVKLGREPAMYTDINPETGQVLSPNVVVRPAAAADIVRLAGVVLDKAKEYLSINQPPSATQIDDEFFAMGTTTSKKLTNTGDFWEYYIDRAEAGEKDLGAAAVEYRKQFVNKGRLYKTNPDGAA